MYRHAGCLFKGHLGIFTTDFYFFMSDKVRKPSPKISALRLRPSNASNLVGNEPRLNKVL